MTEDRWSTWLTKDRFAGCSDGELQAMASWLAHIRDGVLGGAGLRAGAHVVDLGAGTGLLALGAVDLVGPTGMVTAVDISRAALRALDASVNCVTGDATHLPLRDSVADAVVARSVLIYIDDLAGTFQEISRILRPGGRFSLFEPINSGHRHDAALDIAEDDLAAIAELRKETPAGRTMQAFDEPTATALAQAAGLTVRDIRLESHIQRLADAAAVDGYLNRRPHPGAPSALDQVRTALGDDTARRYQQAWHRALSHRGMITFTTPVLFAQYSS